MPGKPGFEEHLCELCVSRARVSVPDADPGEWRQLPLVPEAERGRAVKLSDPPDSTAATLLSVFLIIRIPYEYHSSVCMLLYN